MLARVLLVLGLAAFAALAVAARQTPYLPFDPAVSHAVQSVQATWLDTLARDVSYAGYPPQVDVLVGLVAVGAWLRGQRWVAVGIAVAGAGAGALYFGTELLVDQPRPTPDLVRVAASLPTSAFPSGHETTFTAVLGFLAYCARLSWRRYAGVLVAMVLLAIAWARLYQGQHWASEVLAGVLLGGIWLVATIWIYQRLCRRYTRACRSSPPAAPRS
jgi:membrane-associated phospholipid phosphatase